jgi:hypothetical protein
VIGIKENIANQHRQQNQYGSAILYYIEPDQLPRCGRPPALSATIHYNCRDSKETNEHFEVDVDIQWRVLGISTASLFGAGIMTRELDITCDLRHSEKCVQFKGWHVAL